MGARLAEAALGGLSQFQERWHGIGLDTAPRGEEAPTRAIMALTAPIPAVLRHQRLAEGNVLTRREHVALGRDRHIAFKDEKAVVLPAAATTLAHVDPSFCLRMTRSNFEGTMFEASHD